MALADLGFVKNPTKLDAERLMDAVMIVGGWYLEDREYQVSTRRVAKVIEITTDPRSDYFSLLRRESVPADELMGRRMETGVLACLAQLGAKRNWHRIMREWVYADPPATELGEQEWAYFEERGVKRVPATRVGERRRRGALRENSRGSFVQMPSAPSSSSASMRARRRPSSRSACSPASCAASAIERVASEW